MKQQNECCEPSLRSRRRTLKSVVGISRSSLNPLGRSSEGKISSLTSEMDANVIEWVNPCRGPPITTSASKLGSSAKESERRA